MRTEIEFNADGTTLRGWLYLPDEGTTPFPVVVMAHGFAMVKEQALDKFASVFANAGLASFVYDNRGTGTSDGQPRGDINPYLQMEDYRYAITYAQTLPELDADAIGIWGTSYSGAHVLAVAAVDRRVKCVVAQVPATSGIRTAQRLMTPDMLAGLRKQLDEERTRLVQGKHPSMIQMVALDPNTPCAFPGERLYKAYTAFGNHAPNWRNECTLRSLDWWLEYDVTAYAKAISPTPLLMILASEDQISPLEIQLETFESAHEPKKVVIVAGDHFAAYLENFEKFSSMAATYFKEHLH